ncbi:MAG: serine/threonine-protein kinase [Archangium sp.]|nr:serine/threonine-protein kinase [Archangium sp.]
MTSDRDLLQALFVQQLGFAPAGEVMAAGAQWLVQRETGASLGDVLQSRGVLDARQLQLVEALVSEAIAAHGGDAAITLRSLPPLSQDSLSGLASTLRSGEANATPEKLDLAAATTSFDSLETPENIGVEAKGRYTFDTGKGGKVKELGRGGAGRVVVARDHFLSRDVAMKELHREITQNVKFDTLHVRNLEARFLREARVTGQLEHPAIVPVYELGRRRDGTMYYTMRQVRGRTLAQALTDTRSLEGRLALLPDLLTACRAVAAAHHREVVHRDLKPQNVMLGPHGETSVMDWGLARVMGRADRRTRASSADGTVQLAPDLTGGRDLGPVGTPSYMSPEQAQGNRDELDARSDVWGLGAMLFEILTGRAPYLGKSPWDVLAEVRSKPPPRVLSLSPAAPPELVAVCERALAWNRDHRYPHAGELALELEAFLAGKRVKAYEYTLGEVAGRVLKRHRAKATLALATFTALLVLAGFSAVSVGRERDEARQMARFFLADVAPTLADVPGTSEVIGQLSHSALEAFSADVDPLNGAREDRLLLARTWNGLAHQHWRLGRRPEAREALERAQRMLGPLVEQRPDDPDALAAQLEHEVWRSDLLIDEGSEAEALALLEGQLERAQRVRTLAPGSPPVLSAHTLLLSRISIIRYTRGEMRLGMEISRRSRDSAWEYYRAAPDDLHAAVSVLDESNNLALGQLMTGARADGLNTLRTVIELAQTMRARRDSRALQAGHATVLASLARGLHPVTDRQERRRVVADARRLLADLIAADPGRNSELSDASELALLDGDLPGAWQYAERVEALGLGAEYDAAVLSAAFAIGQDELIRQKARAPVPGAPAAVALFGALVEALAGNTLLARAHLAKCEELKCAEVVDWFPAALLHRVEGRTDATALMLKKLAEDTPLTIGGHEALAKGLRALDAHLGGEP